MALGTGRLTAAEPGVLSSRAGAVAALSVASGTIQMANSPPVPQTSTKSSGCPSPSRSSPEAVSASTGKSTPERVTSRTRLNAPAPLLGRVMLRLMVWARSLQRAAHHQEVPLFSPPERSEVVAMPTKLVPATTSLTVASPTLSTVHISPPASTTPKRPSVSESSAAFGWVGSPLVLFRPRTTPKRAWKATAEVPVESRVPFSASRV